MNVWRAVEHKLRDRPDGTSPGQSVARRLVQLAGFISGSGSAEPAGDEGGADAARSMVEEWLSSAEPRRVWQAHAILRAELPSGSEVINTCRLIRLDGGAAGVDEVLRCHTSSAEVRLVHDAVLCDVGHTTAVGLGTGIQRVVRGMAREWADRPEVVFVAWTADLRGLRRLSPGELDRLLGEGRRPASGEMRATDDSPSTAPEVVIPVGGSYVLPEVSLERERNERIIELVRYGGLRTGVVGHDCVPVTSAETTAALVSGQFALYLCALREVDRVCTVGTSSYEEFDGWRSMLAAAGLTGPDLRHISNPLEAGTATAKDDVIARARYRIADLPLVLCVGSHEPRKNHSAVLAGAERAWAAGAQFHLLFVGGNAWQNERFARALARLQAAGRPVELAKGVPDETMWALYAQAHFTIFPSLNEGFGLPIVESLALGTPCITSNYGTMAHLARGRGGYLVDPRDDAAIGDAMERLLGDPDEHRRLVAESANLPRWTWSDYGDEVWRYLVTHELDPARPTEPAELSPTLEAHDGDAD